MFRPPSAVDVLISGFTTQASKERLTSIILRHTKFPPERGTDIASRILAGRKVMFQMESQASADSMADELRASCFIVSVTK